MESQEMKINVCQPHTTLYLEFNLTRGTKTGALIVRQTNIFDGLCCQEKVRYLSPVRISWSAAILRRFLTNSQIGTEGSEYWTIPVARTCFLLSAHLDHLIEKERPSFRIEIWFWLFVTKIFSNHGKDKEERCKKDRKIPHLQIWKCSNQRFV